MKMKYQHMNYFHLLFAPKKNFDTFKVSEPSKDTMPTKVKRRNPQPRIFASSEFRFPLTLASKDSVDPNHEESHHPFDPSTQSYIAYINIVGRCLAALSSSKYPRPKAHSLLLSSAHPTLQSFLTKMIFNTLIFNLPLENEC